MHILIESITANTVPEIGEKEALTLKEKAQKEYEKLLQENTADNDAYRKHSVDYIYPAAALCIAAKEMEIDTAVIVTALREHFRVTCAADNAVIKRQMKIPFAYHLVPRFFLSYSLRHYPEEAGFRYRIPKREKGKGAFDIIRCPYLETFKKYGCPEITTAFCDSDDFTYGDMHPGLVWERKGTLGYGNECCDFCIREI